MGIRHYRPYTPSRRNMTSSTFEEITKKTPEKSLLAKKKKNSGRNFFIRNSPTLITFAFFINSNTVIAVAIFRVILFIVVT